MERNVKACKLHLALGEVEICPGPACSFWEEGGVALPPGCELERLGVDLDRADLARYLLDLRERLEAARDREERTAARQTFAGLVPPELSGR